MSLIRRFGIVGALVLVLVGLAGWRRPIGHHGVGGLIFDFTNGVPAGINTARTGGTIYVANGLNTVHAISANAPVWENMSDGRGGGVWSFNGYTNFAPDPFNLANGFGANPPVNTGWVHQNGDQNVTLQSSGLAPIYAAAVGGITLVASPWTGFTNALNFDGVIGSGTSLTAGHIGPKGGAFTVEAKIERAAQNKYGYVWTSTTGSFINAWINFPASGNQVQAIAADSAGTTHNLNGTTQVSSGTLHDVALVWDGSTTIYLFLDGHIEDQQPLTSMHTTDPTPYQFQIGSGTTGDVPFTGIIDEVRYSNVARYTSAYTPATSPFTPDANTILLFHADSLTSTYTSGLAAPDGTNNATELLSSGTLTTSTTPSALTATYSAGGVGDTVNAVSSIWMKDASTFLPSVTGAVAAEPYASLGAGMSNGSNANWHRVSTLFFKSGSTNSGFQLYPSGATVAAKTGGASNLPFTTDASATGGVVVFGAQLTEQQDADIPLVSGSTSQSVISLDPSLFNQVLQPNGDFYASGAYLMDSIATYQDNGSAISYMFAMNNADGVTGFGFPTIGSNTQTAWFNGVATSSSDSATESLFWYGVPAEVKWEMWSRPSTDNTFGFSVRFNGCRYIYSSHNTAPTIHAPTSAYLGSNNSANSAINVRHTYWSFNPFNPNQAEGVISGDSIEAFYTTIHMPVCAWTYTLSEAHSKTGIADLAVVGDTIEGQQIVFDNSAYGSGAAQVKWIWNQAGTNDMGGGGKTAAQTSALMTTALADYHTRQPAAHLYVAPITPTSGSTVPWAVVSEYNSDVAGTGPNPVVCPVGATCYFLSYANTWFNTLDTAGNGVLRAAYDSGDHLHENDLGGQIIGTTMRTQLLANGDL